MPGRAARVPTVHSPIAWTAGAEQCAVKRQLVPDIGAGVSGDRLFRHPYATSAAEATYAVCSAALHRGLVRTVYLIFQTTRLACYAQGARARVVPLDSGEFCYIRYRTGGGAWW